MKYKVFPKIRNRTSLKFNTKLGTWNAVFWCNMMTSQQIQDGGRTPYWKSFFRCISAPYWPINAKFVIEMKNHMQIGHVIKTAIFANSRWWTAAILKIALSPYLSRELPDFDQIWYTQMQICIAIMEIWQTIQIFFKFKMADGRYIENHFWLYLGAILANYRKTSNLMRPHI